MAGYVLVHRRRRGRMRRALASSALAVVCTGAVWLYFSGDEQVSLAPPYDAQALPSLTTDRPEDDLSGQEPVDGPERGITPTQAAPRNAAQPQPNTQSRGPAEHAGSATQAREESSTHAARTPTTPNVTPGAVRASTLLQAGRQAMSSGDVITARAQLNEALRTGAVADEAAQVRAELMRLATETIFSSRLFDNDPYVDRYVVQPGDTLGKIATAHKVTADFLAQINGLANKNVIQLGQTLKVVRGPFRAVVDKSSYTLDVYLDNLFVRQFKVGLGEDDRTPTGEWAVKNKLVNPTYYPPRGGQIIAADDPENPLGERWIGLEGVSGAALGQLRYGIHGTIEPDSIGKSRSLGCIRLYNQDVEVLYDLLIEKHSTVAVQD